MQTSITLVWHSWWLHTKSVLWHTSIILCKHTLHDGQRFKPSPKSTYTWSHGCMLLGNKTN